MAIGAAVLMASMSGSALADTAALATILLPMMRQQSYPMNTSAGLIASGGIIASHHPAFHAVRDLWRDDQYIDLCAVCVGHRARLDDGGRADFCVALGAARHGPAPGPALCR